MEILSWLILINTFKSNSNMNKKKGSIYTHKRKKSLFTISVGEIEVKSNTLGVELQ